LLLSNNDAFSQAVKKNIKFSNISIKDGLSQSSPNCIFQDSRGFIWIGTEDGLNKYDGFTFGVYRPVQNDPNSISNPRILAISEDKSGNLWIGTNGGGLNKYNRKTNKFTMYLPGSKDSLSLSGRVVHSIVATPDNELWAGTDNGLSLMNLETGAFIDLNKVYANLANLSGKQVNCLVFSNKTLWIGTNQGLFKLNLNTGSLDHYVHDPANGLSIPDNRITSLLISKANMLLVGTETSLCITDQHSGIFDKPLSGTNKLNTGRISKIKAMLEDESGDIWIATFGNGLFLWSPKGGDIENLTYDHNNPYSLRNNEVLSLYCDFSGIIWVGSNGLDVYNSKKEKFTLYDYVPYSNDKLIFRNIHPIYVDNYEVMWIGSKTDGLHILDRANRTYKRLVHQEGVDNGLSSSKIRAIREYPEGILWVGTEDQGLNKIYLNESRNPVRFEHFQHEAGNPNSITSNKIYAFHIDSQGRLWIGTDNGLTIMDIESETFRQYLPDTVNPKNLNNNTVYSIFGDRSGNIWLATDLGINRYNPEIDGFTHYTHHEKDENTVIHNEILCFYEDQQGKIWIGTYGKGLDQLDPKTGQFRHFSDITQLSTAVVYGILEDDDHNLWMSTNNGILKFRPERGTIKKFSIEDGLQSNEFNGTSYFKGSNGEMFFGGQYGLNSFYPRSILIDTVAPRIVLTDFQVHNISVAPGEDSPLQTHINEAGEITIRHGQNNFTLYFAALHFANPALNGYKYKLEGFDREWIDAGNRRFVSYTNLPYKTYTFRVIASNSDGIWNNKGLEVKIRVKPPFWRTVWFYIFAVLFITWAIVILIRERIKNAQRQKQIFEDKLKESSKELESARIQMENQHAEIVIQKRELLQREKDQENLIWFNQGIGLFSDLIGANKLNLQELCKEVIEKLVEYVEAQQGGVFLLNDEDKKNPFIELIASYAFSESRSKAGFKIGEGYVGTCFSDKEFIEVDNLPDSYSELSSGLGKVSIKHLVLAPLKVNENCIGVLELGSFKKIKGYKVSFIEKLMETFASTISSEQANSKLKQLIDQSRQQALILKENEDKLRQNLEEMMATQEEAATREDELIKMAEEAASREEMLSQQIEALRCRVEELTGQPFENQSSSL
jgi:ligand-binding sensor domain-containing protein/GAF domain-containing protein